MILVYIDETGINYSQNANGYFDEDGPYAIWSSVLISEKRYFDVERSFQDLAKKYLGISTKKHVLHATEIWKDRKTSSQNETKTKKYFEELIQLTAKLHVPVLFGIQQKNPNLSKKTKKNSVKKEKELEKARYSLLSLIEQQLAAMNETAILVSDNEGIKTEALKNLVFNRTKWRYSPSTRKRFGTIKPKYLFEYQSNLILDQLHYVISTESLLTQFSDHICFVIGKTMEHLYLLNFPKNGQRPVANKNLVPISEKTFNVFAEFCNIQWAYYDEKDKDVSFGQLHPRVMLSLSFEPQSHAYVIGGPPQSDALRILKLFTPFG